MICKKCNGSGWTVNYISHGAHFGGSIQDEVTREKCDCVDQIEEVEVKKRFEDAQVGDFVWAEFYGIKGRIVDIDKDDTYPVGVKFDGDLIIHFTLDGYEIHHHIVSCLYYLDADGNKCTERPEQPIDWEKVEPDTLCYVSEESEKFEPPVLYLFKFYADNRPWFFPTGPRIYKCVTTWKYAKPVK